MQYAGQRDGVSYIEDIRYIRHLNSPRVKSETRELDREQLDSRSS